MAFLDPTTILEQFEIKEGAQVADLGSGSGFYSLAAAKMVRGTDAHSGSGKVYAIDVMSDLLVKLKNAARAAKLTNIETIQGNIEKVGGTRLGNGSIDDAILSNTLFQVDHRPELIEEVKRILKSGGRLLVVDWQDSYGGMGPQPDMVFNESMARELCEGKGLTFENEIDAGDQHYGLVFKKP